MGASGMLLLNLLHIGLFKNSHGQTDRRTDGQGHPIRPDRSKMCQDHWTWL